MPYLGKKPTDFADVTESQTFKVTESLDVQGNELVLDADGDTSITSDTDDVIDFRTAGSDRWQILANGNLKAATDGLGIDFSASGGGSSSVLDDYEEGYYTPTLSATSGSYTLNSSYDRASYVKIGNICHVQGQIVISANNSATGTVSLSLPFTSTAGEDLAGRGMSASLIYATGSGRPNGNGYYTSAVFVGTSTASADIWARPNSATFDTTTGDWFDNGSDIFLQITYRTA